MLIALDFDGTVCKHEYPNIGKDLPNCISILKQLLAKKHQLILNTMRSGKELQEAVNWLNSQGIKLYGINKNPTQTSWTTSPKVYAEIYIDDAALGCPLDKNGSVDWYAVEEILIAMNIL